MGKSHGQGAGRQPIHRQDRYNAVQLFVKSDRHRRTMAKKKQKQKQNRVPLQIGLM